MSESQSGTHVNRQVPRLGVSLYKPTKIELREEVLWIEFSQFIYLLGVTVSYHDLHFVLLRIRQVILNSYLQYAFGWQFNPNSFCDFCDVFVLAPPGIVGAANMGDSPSENAQGSGAESWGG